MNTVATEDAGRSSKSWWFGGDSEPPRWLAGFEPLLKWLGCGDALAGVWLAGILIVTLLVVSRSLGGDFVIDDRPLIVDNPFLKSWSFAWRSLSHNVVWYMGSHSGSSKHIYRPLFDFWLTLCYHLFGLYPGWWRGASIAVHLIVVWEVFRVVSLLRPDRLTALGAAALFALMPIHMQAIVWPAVVACALDAAFLLGAFEFYLRATASPESSAMRLRRIGVSLGLYAGALMAYEGAVVLPVLIAAHAFILRPDGTGQPRARFGARVNAVVAASWPYVIEVGIYLVIRRWAIGEWNSSHFSLLKGAHPILKPFLLAQGFCQIWRSFIVTFAIPWDTEPIRYAFGSSTAPVVNPFLLEFYLPFVSLMAPLIVGWMILRRHRHWRLYQFGAAWMIIALTPYLNLLGSGMETADQDRFFYLPSFGICLIAADLARCYMRAEKKRANAVVLCGAAVLLIYAVTLFHVQTYFFSNVAIWTRYTKMLPHDSNSRFRLGLALEQRGELRRARAEFQKHWRWVPLPPGGSLTISFRLMTGLANRPRRRNRWRNGSSTLASLRRTTMLDWLQLTMPPGTRPVPMRH